MPIDIKYHLYGGTLSTASDGNGGPEFLWAIPVSKGFFGREVDQDSDGRISFKEFESAMKYGQDEVSPVYFAYRIFSGGKTK